MLIQVMTNPCIFLIALMTVATATQATVLECRISTISIIQSPNGSDRAIASRQRVGDIFRIDTSDADWKTTDSQYQSTAASIPNSRDVTTINRETGLFINKMEVDGSSLIVSGKCSKLQITPRI